MLNVLNYATPYFFPQTFLAIYSTYQCMKPLHHNGLTVIICYRYHTQKGPILFPYTGSTFGVLDLHYYIYSKHDDLHKRKVVGKFIYQPITSICNLLSLHATTRFLSSMVLFVKSSITCFQWG